MIKIIARNISEFKAKRVYRPVELGEFVPEEGAITLTRIVESQPLMVWEAEVGSYATLLTKGSIDLNDGRRISINNRKVEVSNWNELKNQVPGSVYYG